MANSRVKGASGERQVAKILQEKLGLDVKRELRQTQNAGFGDLVCEPCIGFNIEVKTYAKGTGCKESWWEQSSRAAARSGLIPVVIYKYDRRPWRVEMPLSCVVSDDDSDHRINMSIESFCYFVSITKR